MRVIEQFYVVSVLPPPQNPLHPARWPALGARVRPDGAAVACGGAGAAASVQQADVQAGVSGHGEAGGAVVDGEVWAGDEEDCGSSPQ